MTFKVRKLDAVEKEISELDARQKERRLEDYKKIENQGIEFVLVRPLKGKVFEIKTNEIRSLFKYQQGKIIVVAVVFVKKTQKTPKEIMRLAKQRFSECDL